MPAETAPGVGAVQRDAGQVAVGHHLEDDVLVAVAERRPERIGRVRRRGPEREEEMLKEVIYFLRTIHAFSEVLVAQ